MDTETERPAVGAGALRASVMGVDGWPATSFWGDEEMLSVALREP